MWCWFYKRLANKHMGRCLGPTGRWMLERHLLSCRTCSRELDRSVKLRRLLQGMPRQKAPSYVREAVLQNLSAHQDDAPTRQRLYPLPWKRPVFFTAGVLTLLIFSFLMLRQPHEPSIVTSREPAESNVEFSHEPVLLPENHLVELANDPAAKDLTPSEFSALMNTLVEAAMYVSDRTTDVEGR